MGSVPRLTDLGLFCLARRTLVRLHRQCLEQVPNLWGALLGQVYECPGRLRLLGAPLQKMGAAGNPPAVGTHASGLDSNAAPNMLLGCCALHALLCNTLLLLQPLHLVSRSAGTSFVEGNGRFCLVV
jgi:hypothetical protein